MFIVLFIVDFYVFLCQFTVRQNVKVQEYLLKNTAVTLVNMFIFVLRKIFLVLSANLLSQKDYYDKLL